MQRHDDSLFWARPLLLLLALYLWVSFRYDLHALTVEGGPLHNLKVVQALPTFVLTCVTGMFLLEWARVAPAVKQVRREYPAPSGGAAWLLAGASAAAFLALTHLLFRPDLAAAQVRWAFVAWAGSVLATVVGALHLVLPLRGQLQLVRRLAGPLGLGLVIGGFAWGASQLAAQLWEHLAEATLQSVYGLLNLWGQPVHLVPGTRIIQLPHFAVFVDVACSGYEGVGLIAAFLGAYVWRFRDELRFPHALLLPALGVVLVWVLNNVRIAALMLVGEYISDRVALGGFHSKAGWVLFCATAIGLVVGAQRITWLRRDGARPGRPSRRPASPYLLPFVALLSLGLLTGLVTVGFEHLYPVRIVGAGWVALYSWRVLRPDSLRPHGLALAMGAAVLLMWLALVPSDPELDAIRAITLDGLDPAWRTTWIVLRCLGSALVVPVVEELAFRGFLLRRLVRPDFEKVAYEEVPPWALVISSVAFGVLHPESWTAGSLAGLGYGFVAMRTGRLYDAVVAHALTNAALNVYVLANGHYYLW